MQGEKIYRWLLPLGCALMLAPMAARAQDTPDAAARRDEKPRLITVTGQGEIRRKPDLVTMSVGIEERGQDVQTIRQAAARKAQDAILALQNAGVRREDIQTSQFTIRREWEQEPPPPNPGPNYRPTGKYVFVLDNTVSVRTPMVDKAGDILDAVVKAGFNTISGPNFSLEDDAAARRDALELAVKDARAKAEVIASATGVKIRGVESVAESGGVVPRPTEMYAGRMMSVAADQATPTPIESGQIVITENVTAAFRI